MLKAHGAPSDEADFHQSLVEVITRIDGIVLRRSTGHGDKIGMRGQVDFVAWMDEHGHGVATGVGILGVHDPMGGGLEQTVREVLEHVARINDDGILVTLT